MWMFCCYVWEGADDGEAVFFEFYHICTACWPVVAALAVNGGMKEKNNFLLLRGFFTINFCLFPHTHFLFRMLGWPTTNGCEEDMRSFLRNFCEKRVESWEYEILPQKTRWVEFPTTPMKKFFSPQSQSHFQLQFSCVIFFILIFFIHHHRADGRVFAVAILPRP